MAFSPYYFVVELLSSSEAGEQDAPSLNRLENPGWSRAVEELKLEAFRKNPTISISSGDVTIEPVWDEAAGKPYVERISVRTKDGAVESSLPVADYFHGAARDCMEQWVEEKEEGTIPSLSARILAYPDSGDAGNPESSFCLEMDPPVPFKSDQTLESLLSRSEAKTEPGDETFYTFVTSGVVEEITAAADAGGELETGGILLGHLRRFPDQPGAIGVEITAQIPAPPQLTEATTHSLRFTDEVWDAVQAAKDLRKDDVSVLGWVHSHPARYWEKCPDSCPPESRKNCPREWLQRPFFSRADESVHQHFSKAFHVALLVHCGEASTTVSNFGWQHGRICSRPWHLLDSSRAAPTKEKTLNETKKKF